MPPITLGTPKSVKTRMKTTNVVLIIPYFAPGKVTFKNVLNFPAFRASEASYKRASDNDNEVERIISA